MKKILLSLMLAVSFVGGAYAEDVTQVRTSVDLSPAQKAELAATAAKMAQDNASTTVAGVSTSKVEVVKQWVDIGTAIGSGLAASAKELGVAANEFAQSPVGRFTVFLIAWHFIGATLVHIGFTILWFIGAGSVLLWAYRRNSFQTTVTKYERGKGPNGVSKVVERKRLTGDSVDGTNATIAVFTAVYILAFFIMMGTV